MAVLDVAAAPVEGGGPTLPLWGRVVTYFDVLVVCFVLLCFESCEPDYNQGDSLRGYDGLSSQIKGGKVSIRIPQNSSRKRLREVFVDFDLRVYPSMPCACSDVMIGDCDSQSH